MLEMSRVHTVEYFSKCTNETHATCSHGVVTELCDVYILGMGRIGNRKIPVIWWLILLIFVKYLPRFRGTHRTLSQSANNVLKNAVTNAG